MISPDAWTHNVITAVAAHEGTYSACNPNKDGAGLSFGILQWTQRSGSLGHLLAAMHARDPGAVGTCLGEHARAVIDACLSGELAAIDGCVLWKEPWLSRFGALGQHRGLQGVQLALAGTGTHMAGAVDVARVLGATTERALAVAFDRSVNQGPAGALTVARRVAGLYSADPDKRPALAADVAAQFAWACAARFRAERQAPVKGDWRQVDEEYSELRTGDYHVSRRPVTLATWHRFAGPWSLFDIVTRRSSRLLLSRSLSDEEADLSRWPQ